MDRIEPRDVVQVDLDKRRPAVVVRVADELAEPVPPVTRVDVRRHMLDRQEGHGDELGTRLDHGQTGHGA